MWWPKQRTSKQKNVKRKQAGKMRRENRSFEDSNGMI